MALQAVRPVTLITTLALVRLHLVGQMSKFGVLFRGHGPVMYQNVPVALPIEGESLLTTLVLARAGYRAFMSSVLGLLATCHHSGAGDHRAAFRIMKG